MVKIRFRVRGQNEYASIVFNSGAEFESWLSASQSLISSCEYMEMTTIMKSRDSGFE